jgi:MHS family alpha-ketoglutarate permease-like MFS transporter
MAHPSRRGFYSGVWYTTLIGGQLAAVLLLLILQKVFLSTEELKEWGWRIPFVIGAVLSLYALVMRKELHETEHYQQARKENPTQSLLKSLIQHRRELFLVVGLTIGGTSAFYTYTTYMQKFLKLSVGLDEVQVTMIVVGYLVLALIMQPLYGALSDKVGRKPLLIWFGVMGTVCTYPLLTALSQTTNPWVAFGLISAAWLIVSGYTSITGIIKAELFPTSIRALGVGVPYALTVSIFGGTVDSVALGFKQAGHEQWFYWYATACIFISLLVYLGMRDTLTQSRMENHQ